MKLKKLLKDIPFAECKGSKEIEVSGICANSKLVVPGNLFIAKKGKVNDGSHFIPEAIASGAVAILTDLFDPSLKHIAQIIYHDVASIEGLLSAVYYQFPGDELFMVGITGTNGKTTTASLVKHLLDALNGPCGLIGTIEYIIGDHCYQAIRTTPDVTLNHKLLREMLLKSSRSAVMEVTSHALDQGRVQGIDYDVAVFTNLSLDHLDYHQTMDRYCEAKSQLFKSLNPAKKKKIQSPPKIGVVNADSPWHKKMTEGSRVPIFTYGILSDAVDLRATEIEFTSTHTCFKLCYQGKTFPLKWPYIGRFNVYNCLATISVGLAYQAPIERILEIMQQNPPIVKGRLQLVPNNLNLKIYVDFAHTDDALINVLECLQEIKRGKIITIFGCGGDRDPLKRPKMAQAAEEFSDFSIVTSDNPRSEDPLDIANEIIKGFKNPKHYTVELDRYQAIQKGIQMASPEDIILIAGKGHEPYQVFAYKTVEFDDVKVAANICDKIYQKT
jgi:UDP-N-acetylmuramoyl-L-alanyl-D-glutamate--2,6-diaminopimelate ligase